MKKVIILCLFPLSLLVAFDFYNVSELDKNINLSILKQSMKEYPPETNKKNHPLVIDVTSPDTLEQSMVQSLDDKKAYTQHLDFQFTKKIEENISLLAKEEIDSNIAISSILMKKFFINASNRNWKSFIITLEAIELDTPEFINIALLQAILNDAPLKLIEDLLNRGANFQPGIIHTLVQKGNLDLIKQLHSLGLDLHDLDRHERNALFYAVESMKSREIFNFLLSSGVSVRSSSKGPDLLDASLNNLALGKRESIYYIDKIIAFEAPIQASHEEALKALAASNTHAFEQLMVAQPELRNMLAERGVNIFPPES